MGYFAEKIVGKEIVCLETARNFGRVEKVLFAPDLSALAYLKTEKCLVSVADVYKIEDCVCCVKVSPLPFSDGFCCPLGLEIYTQTGKLMGKCIDVEVSFNFSSKYILTEEQKIVPKRVMLARDSIILKGALPKNQTPLVAHTVVSQKIPYRYSGDFSFLVGRIVTDRILDKNGLVLAEAGQRITDNVVFAAKENGKLLELNKKCIRPNKA